MNKLMLRTELVEAIDIMIKKRLEQFKYNRTEYGKITQVKANGLYEVEINGSRSDIYALDNKIFNTGDVVIIIICNNNYDTGKYILSKRPN